MLKEITGRRNLKEPPPLLRRAAEESLGENNFLVRARR